MKILFCIELTPDRVKSFCSEASMLHALAHPNIVTCHGVAVMPPAICLVTEWCHHGSLYDLLHTSEYYIRDSTVGRLSRLSHSLGHNSQPRASMNIRTSNALSNGDTDSINEITSEGDPFDDHGDEIRHPMRPAASPNNGEHSQHNILHTERTSLTGEIKVISKRFQATTTRRSLPHIGIFENRFLSSEYVDDKDPNWKLNENNFGLKTFSSYFYFFLELDVEKQMPETKPSKLNKSPSKKLKSAASVMQSSSMGYGFGDEIQTTPQSSTK